MKRFLESKKVLYTMVILAIVLESLTSSFLKLGSQNPFLSPMYLFWLCVAVVVLGLYAIIWQLVLEKIPLTTAYLRKGISYILVFIWAAVIFKEVITIKQIIGMAVIFVGMVVSIKDEY